MTPLPDWTPGNKGKGLLVMRSSDTPDDLRVVVWNLSDAAYHALGRDRLGIGVDLVRASIVLDEKGSFYVHEDGAVDGETYEEIVERLDNRLHRDLSPAEWGFE